MPGIKRSNPLLMVMLTFTIIANAQTKNTDPRERLCQPFLTPPDQKSIVTSLRRCNFMLQIGQPYHGATDQRIMDDGTRIRFTDDSMFEITFPDGHQELWNPMQKED